MPFLAPAIPALTKILPFAAAGAGAVGSGLASRSQTSTASTQRTTPEQMQPLESGLIEQILAQIQNPEAGLAPLRMQARNRVNQNYSGVDQALRDRFGRSEGASGKFGKATMYTEVARMRDLSGVEGDFAGHAINQRNTALGLGERMLSFGRGSESTQTMPGNVAGATVGSIGDSLGQMTTLMTLDRILRGGK